MLGSFARSFSQEIPDFSAVLLSTTDISPDNMYHRSMELVEGFIPEIR